MMLAACIVLSIVTAYVIPGLSAATRRLASPVFELNLVRNELGSEDDPMSHAYFPTEQQRKFHECFACPLPRRFCRRERGPRNLSAEKAFENVAKSTRAGCLTPPLYLKETTRVGKVGHDTQLNHYPHEDCAGKNESLSG